MHLSARAAGHDLELVDAASSALEEHWALRSLGPVRRAQILAAATAPAATAEVGVEPIQAAAPRGSRRRGAGRRQPPAPPAVSDADTLHLAGAYDLAGRDAIAALAALRPEGAIAGHHHDAADVERRALDAQLAVAAGRAFVLLAALPVETATDSEVPDPSAADADAAVLHRLLHLAALAEVGGRRGDWLRWVERNAAALADRLPSSADAPAPIAMDGDAGWEPRLRALVVGAWLELLRRSGPSGLDEAAALLARVREERDVAEAAWLRGVEAAGGEVAVVRARFRLFALAHVGDAAVDTLLYLRHGARHASPEAADRAVRRRLQLAREAGAGDVQLDGVLTWLREAARRVIARGSPQLEIGVGG